MKVCPECQFEESKFGNYEYKPHASGCSKYVELDGYLLPSSPQADTDCLYCKREGICKLHRSLHEGTEAIKRFAADTEKEFIERVMECECHCHKTSPGPDCVCTIFSCKHCVSSPVSWEKRVWVFVASNSNVPFFSKLFTDHTEMKEFSAKHSSFYKKQSAIKYSSDYFDLTDTSLLATEREKAYHDGCHETDLKVLENFNKGLRDETSELVKIIREAGFQEGKEAERERVRKIVEDKIVLLREREKTLSFDGGNSTEDYVVGGKIKSLSDILSALDTTEEVQP